MKSFREHIGIVPQSAMMFNMTIMENVRYSRLTATDDEVINACKVAAVHHQVSSFKDGYQAVVGENGVKLSGYVDLRAFSSPPFVGSDPNLCPRAYSMAEYCEMTFDLIRMPP